MYVPQWTIYFWKTSFAQQVSANMKWPQFLSISSKFISHTLDRDCIYWCLRSTCLWKFALKSKPFPHRWHVCRFSPAWTDRLWRFKVPGARNLVWQMEHWKGFLPVCTSLCQYSVPAEAKAASQTWQRNGFSPVWTSLCSTRVWFRPKDFPHVGHTKGFTPSWTISTWDRSCSDRLKAARHRLHWKFFSKWTKECTLRVSTVANTFWHTPQL